MADVDECNADIEWEDNRQLNRKENWKIRRTFA